MRQSQFIASQSVAMRSRPKAAARLRLSAVSWHFGRDLLPLEIQPR